MDVKGNNNQESSIFQSTTSVYELTLNIGNEVVEWTLNGKGMALLVAQIWEENTLQLIKQMTIPLSIKRHIRSQKVILITPEKHLHDNFYPKVY